MGRGISKGKGSTGMGLAPGEKVKGRRSYMCVTMAPFQAKCGRCHRLPWNFWIWTFASIFKIQIPNSQFTPPDTLQIDGRVASRWRRVLWIGYQVPNSCIYRWAPVRLSNSRGGGHLGTPALAADSEDTVTGRLCTLRQSSIAYRSMQCGPISGGDPVMDVSVHVDN